MQGKCPSAPQGSGEGLSHLLDDSTFETGTQAADCEVLQSNSFQEKTGRGTFLPAFSGLSFENTERENAHKLINNCCFIWL